MRAVRFHDRDGCDVLQVDDIRAPEPAAGEILVEAAAAGVDPVGMCFHEGSYQSFAISTIPSVGVTGTVATVGTDVEGFTEGDHVVGTDIDRDRHGGYTELTTVPTDRFAILSDDVSFTAASGVSVTGVTAWRVLVNHDGTQLGDAVLIHDGSGSVGHATV